MEINGELKEKNKIEILSDEKISLHDVLNSCKKCLENIEDSLEYDDLLKSIVVNKYLPMSDKFDILNRIYVINQYPNGDPAYTSIYIEMYKLWDGLLRYTNIDVDNYENLKTIENYDIIYSVIGEQLIGLCALDYSRLCQMVDNMLNLSKISDFIDSIGYIENDDESGDEKISDDIAQIMKNKEIFDIIKKDYEGLI